MPGKQKGFTMMLWMLISIILVAVAIAIIATTSMDMTNSMGRGTEHFFCNLGFWSC